MEIVKIRRRYFIAEYKGRFFAIQGHYWRKYAPVILEKYVKYLFEKT